MLTLLTYFTYLLYLPVRKRFFCASKAAKETRSAHEQRANERTSQSPVASRRPAVGGRQSAVGELGISKSRYAYFTLLTLLYLLYLLTYLLYLLTIQASTVWLGSLKKKHARMA